MDDERDAGAEGRTHSRTLADYVPLIVVLIAAVLIVSVVASGAAIYLFADYVNSLFNPEIPPNPVIPPRSCTLPSGFSCPQFMSLGRSGRIYLALGQVTGHDITVTSFGCNESSEPVPAPLAHPVAIANGKNADVLAGDSGNFVTCCPNVSGAACRPRIAFGYVNAGSGLTRIAYGQLSDTVP